MKKTYDYMKKYFSTLITFLLFTIPMFAQRGRLSQDDWEDLNGQSSGSGGGFFVFLVFIALIIGAIYLYAKSKNASSSQYSQKSNNKPSKSDWDIEMENLARMKKKDKQENIGCIIALIIMVLWVIIFFASNPQYL